MFAAVMLVSSLGAQSTVFVHSWARDERSAPQTLSIAQEMLQELNLSWPVQVTTVAAAVWPIPTEVRTHVRSGFEDVTLNELHQFCLRAPQATVVYVHTKGAYHPSARNTQLRQNMIMAAKTCVHNVTREFDVCGHLFNNVPLPHFYGNMWTAKCSYIQRLVPASTWKHKFKSRYYRGDMQFTSMKAWCLSALRYSDETWVLGHPLARVLAINGVHRRPHEATLCTSAELKVAKTAAGSFYPI